MHIVIESELNGVIKTVIPQLQENQNIIDKIDSIIDSLLDDEIKDNEMDDEIMNNKMDNEMLDDEILEDELMNRLYDEDEYLYYRQY